MVKQIMQGMVLVLATVFAVNAQSNEVGVALKKNEHTENQKIVVVTGARFSYKLVQKWIDDFNEIYPDVQIVIESRGSSDPLQYDILAEVYEHDAEIKKDRQYLYVGRYAILPVATTQSQFAKTYAQKGLSNKLIKQIFFHNIFADKDEEEKIKVPFTVYTRFQKAGAPKVFAEFYGLEQKDINGKAIAGSDEHLLKALLRDSTGITYLPLPLVYDPETKKTAEGLTIIPIDIDGNGKVKDDEKTIFASNEILMQKLEEDRKDKNVPIGHFHLSVNKNKVSTEAVTFLKWVTENGQSYLHDYGFLKALPNQVEKEQFNALASKKGIN